MATPWVILGRFLQAEEEARAPRAAAAAAAVDADALVLPEHHSAAANAEAPKVDDDVVFDAEAEDAAAAAVDADALVLPEHHSAAANAEDPKVDDDVFFDAEAEDAAAAAVDADALVLPEHHSAAANAEDPKVDDDVFFDAEAEDAAAAAVDADALVLPEHHSAAEPEFSLSLATPPRVTILDAVRGAHPDPDSPDLCPYVIAAGPVCLLVHFTGPFFFGSSFTDSLVLVRDFHKAAEGQATASAARVPNRGNRLPTLWYIEHVLFDSDDRGHYTIAELQVHKHTHSATLVCLGSGDDVWSVKDMAYPPLPAEDREWTPHGAVSVDDTFWWFDLSWGILSCAAAALAEPDLIFHELPGRHLAGATPAIHTNRCVAASRSKLRYVEIVTEDGDAAALLRMWSRRRHDHSGWMWHMDCMMNFKELWDDISYKDAGLPRNVPGLAVVCPSDPNLVYFALEKCLFGVNVSAHKMLHSDRYELVNVPGPPRPASSRYVVAWELPPAAAQALEMSGWTWAQPHGLGAASNFEPEGSFQLPMPRLHVDSDEVKIFEVWKDTSKAAFSQIGDILRSVGSGNCLVALDTEFCIPDGVQCLPYEPPTPDDHYMQLQSYVYGGDLVQVGIGIADTEFNLFGGTMFQFNLLFDPTRRSGDHSGVKFLRESGLILEEHARNGLPALEFMSMLRESGLLQNKNVTWVTFMGYPDFGFMIHLLMKEPLPKTRLQFLLQVADYFPSSCDCKFFSKYGKCINMERIPGKLDAVATELGAKRTGKGHQAASDALLSLRCLQRLKGLAPDSEFYNNTCGVLYGVGGCQ